MARTTKNAAKTTKTTKATKAIKTAKAPKVEQLFKGQVPAQKVFMRKLEGFSAKQGNNCPAIMWFLFQGETVCVANTYNAEQTPKSSYDPETYTYSYKPAVHDPKMESMTEVEATEWPEWITNSRRKARKAK
jgi:hypothetical protein